MHKLITFYLLSTVVLLSGFLPLSIALAAPTPTLSSVTSDESKDEAALGNLVNGTVPEQLAENPPTKLKGIFEIITDFIFNQVLGFRPSFESLFAARADVANNATIPNLLSPSSSSTPLEEVANDLGKNSGIYSLSLPLEVKGDLKTTRDFERAFERANFPDGVHPITPN